MTTQQQLETFSIDVHDGVAVVTMDVPGATMNTLGPKVMDDALVVLDRLETDPEIEAVVLASGKKDSFLAGADINWFETLTDADEATAFLTLGHGVFNRMEEIHTTFGKPVIAAIHGPALGGGLEYAMTASMRIATNSRKTSLGQPEVQLGLLPAGGGTQRLPALVGIANALDLILTGRSIDARKARKLGLVDEVVPPEVLMDVAIRRAREAADAPAEDSGGGLDIDIEISAGSIQKLALEKNRFGRDMLFKQARQRALKESKGNYPAPDKIIDAIKIGIEDGREAGLAAEARFFGELVTSPESKALRSIFFASQALKNETWVDAEPKPVERVAVIGGGLMGGGIAAMSASRAAASVRVKEIDTDGVGRALRHVSDYLAGRVKRKRMRPFEAEKTMLRVTGSTNWTGFATADLVIEAVFESLELKRTILREVEGIVGDDTVFASNTSTLPITDIAAASSRPETVLGMHYFSPVEKMPLLEVIVTDQTADWATATAIAHGKAQGKTVIVVNDGTGFYTSRVITPYSNEAMHLLAEGASVEAIDGAMETWGMPVGPIQLADEVGLDVGAKVSEIMVAAFGDRMAAPGIMEGLAADDRQGRKNRRGFYAYDEKGARDGVDESVYEAIGGTRRAQIPTAQIQQRVALAFVNEAARCLEEDILRSARDGDMGAVMGLGFPPFRGGPFWYVDEVGAAKIVGQLEALAAAHGARFAPAQILRDAAESGRRFRS